MQKLVAEQVMAFESRYKHQVLQLTIKSDLLQERLEKQEQTIAAQNQEIYELKTVLQLESAKVESFKDPEGCVQLRVLLQDFEQNIRNITKEKSA